MFPILRRRRNNEKNHFNCCGLSVRSGHAEGGDNTCFVLSLRNRGGISFEAGYATFVVESRKKGKRSVQFDRNLVMTLSHRNINKVRREWGYGGICFFTR